MNPDGFRDFCLSLPGAQERFPFAKLENPAYDDHIAFTVGGKLFALVDMARFEFCNLKCAPEHSLRLQEIYTAVRPGYHMNHRHWISVYFQGDLPDALVLELVRDSHALVLATLPRFVRVQLGLD